MTRREAGCSRARLLLGLPPGSGPRPPPSWTLCGDVRCLALRVRRPPKPPAAGAGPSPPLGRGGAPGPSRGKPSAPVSVRPLLPPRPARRAGALPPSPPHRHPHPLPRPPLQRAQLRDKRGAGATTRPAARPQQAPFTAPLGLQTVTLATDLSAASRAPAARTRRTLIGASAAPPCAARQAPPPPPAARAPIGPRLGPPLPSIGPRPLPAPPTLPLGDPAAAQGRAACWLRHEPGACPARSRTSAAPAGAPAAEAGGGGPAGLSQPRRRGALRRLVRSGPGLSTSSAPFVSREQKHPKVRSRGEGSGTCRSGRVRPKRSCGRKISPKPRHVSS